MSRIIDGPEVERVARAIARHDLAFSLDWKEDDPRLAKHIDQHWHEYEGDARAALAAHHAALDSAGLVIVPREPTEAMLVRGWNGQHAGYGIGKARLPDVWRAMCDAALPFEGGEGETR